VLQTTRGDVYHFTLPAGVAEQLRGIAREEGTTLYTVLAAAFSAFLSRSCGGLDDIIIGTPVSCRNTTQVQYSAVGGRSASPPPSLSLYHPLSLFDCCVCMCAKRRDVFRHAEH
jgi:hypothetical protein